MDFRVSVPGYIREVSVPKIPFPRPVSIFVGLGFPREIDSVLEAYQLLNEWPQTTRGPKHLDALHNCAAVLGGRGSARDARRAFEAFAADRGILASDLLQMSANRYATEWLGAAR